MTKTLRSFIAEEHDFQYHGDSDDPQAPGYHSYEHHGEVGPHRVRVELTRRDRTPNSFGQNHYDARFSVDHAHSRERVDAHGPRVLHHVGRVVDAFVRKHKPASVGLMAHDVDPSVSDHKHAVYGHFAKKLARAHRGDYEEGDVSHRVYF